MDDVQIRVRGDDRRQVATVGAPVQFEAILRHAPPSSWRLTVAADDPVATQLVPGNGVVVRHKHGRLFSGPILPITESRGGELGGDPSAGGAPGADPGGTVTVAGEDDTTVLSRRLAYADPALALTESGVTGHGHYEVSGAAETVLRALVDLNAGPSALPDRRVQGLTLAPDQARGADVETSLRFDTLLAAMSGLAVSGGVGFRVVQSGTDLEFQVYEPADLSGVAKFSFGLGNLNSYTYEIKPPEVTDVVVACGGEDTAREFFLFTRPDPVWPEIRAELFADRRDLEPGTAKTANQAAQEAAERLDEGVGTAKISFEPIDTPNLAFGRDYNVGDTVTVELGRGTVTEVVREVRVTLDEQGVKVVPVIGADGTSSSPRIYQAVGRLIRQVHHLEVSR